MREEYLSKRYQRSELIKTALLFTSATLAEVVDFG
jgi:hypothetical protein